MTQEQLYRASVNSGLNMSWDEFSGSTVSVCGVADPATGASRQRGPFTGVGSTLIGTKPSVGFQLIPTTGSILVLNFAEVIQISEEFLAPGSLGIL
jgi:hypothetical protein